MWAALNIETVHSYPFQAKKWCTETPTVDPYCASTFPNLDSTKLGHFD